MTETQEEDELFRIVEKLRKDCKLFWDHQPAWAVHDAPDHPDRKIAALWGRLVSEENSDRTISLGPALTFTDFYKMAIHEMRIYESRLRKKTS